MNGENNLYGHCPKCGQYQKPIEDVTSVTDGTEIVFSETVKCGFCKSIFESKKGRVTI